MENASKALIMAGSVLIALMIIGALLLMFNNLSTYQESNVEETRQAQISEFNSQFATYDRKDIRGSDMVSLVHRIIDYNTRKLEEGYTKMKIDIEVGSGRTQMTYDPANAPKLIKSKYDETNIQELVGTKTDKSKPKGLEDKYGTPYISELSSNISNIMDTSATDSTTGMTRGEQVADEILPKPLSSYGGIEKIRNDTVIYYEYSQFKRAYFNCEETKYDKDTGRITYMKFKFNKMGV